MNQYSYLPLFLAHSSVNLDVPFIILETQTTQKGLYLNRKDMCVLLLKLTHLFLAQQLTAKNTVEDNLEGNTEGNIEGNIERNKCKSMSH